MTIGDAKNKIKKFRPDGKIRLSMESPKYFIFEVVPKSASDNDEYDDSLFYVDKKSGKVDGYQPSMDWDDYDKAVIID